MVKIKKFLSLIALLSVTVFQSCENLSNTSTESERYTPYILSESISPLQFNTTLLQSSNGNVQLSFDLSMVEFLNGSDAKKIERFQYEIINTNDSYLNFSGNIENTTSSPADANNIRHNGKISIEIKDSDIGNYLLRIYGTNSETNNSNSILANFIVIRENNPPVIEQVTAPDTLTVDADTPPQTQIPVLISAKVFDKQGTADISRVYFNSYRPDGSPANGNPFNMFDDGTNGDLTANDGIYSLRIYITPENLKGTYRFDFYALDRSNLRSEVYQHFMVVR